jgi:nucleoside phosphorylase
MDCGSTDPWASVVVLAALGVEAAALSPLLTDWSATPGMRSHYAGYIGSRRVVVYPIAGSGNLHAAIAARDAIATWNPEYVILCGIAGGFRAQHQHLGDILVPRQVVNYETGKLSNGKFEHRYEAYHASHKLIKAAEFAQRTSWWARIPPELAGRRPDKLNVHFGVLASGEKVIADKEWGEMESLGVAHAAYDVEPAWGVVKAVSDFADSHKRDNWQPFAAATAAAFVVAMIEALGPPPDRRPAPG